MRDIKVSVAMTTYNHEKYIAQAIDGVLMQKTNFPIELIIGDDFSTDNTLKICLDYQKKFPDIIRVILAKKNEGLRENNFKVWTNCFGQYIAYCEGDDFWIDDNKLQKQIDFLDLNKQFSGAFHQVKMFYDDRKYNFFTPLNQKKTLNFEENIERWVVATCGLVFRNIFKNIEICKYGNILLSDRVFWSDRPLMAFLTKIGDFYYFPDVMGCWRQHDTNMTKIGNLAEMSAYGGMSYAKMIDYFPENKIKLSEQVIRWYLIAYFYSFKNKNFKNMFRYNWLSFKNIKSLLGLKNYIKCTSLVLIGREIYT